MTQRRPCIVVHGGAGNEIPSESHEVLREGCLAAARAGYALLDRGGSAVDAVEVAARALEDHPSFNAGTGSVLNAAGHIEMDAAWMDGRELKAGAVAGITRIRNPITLARAVAEKTAHVLLAGAGANAFADELGMERIAEELLVTPKVRARWEEQRARGGTPSFGTIGAVAVDAEGHVAAATSTGGLSFKRPGRVGDSPLIGLGTYADDESGAASATGHGESIMKVVLARMACEALRQSDAQKAAEAAIARLARVRGQAGIILVRPDGDFGIAFNTARMSRAWIRSDGQSGAAVLP